MDMDMDRDDKYMTDSSRHSINCCQCGSISNPRQVLSYRDEKTRSTIFNFRYDMSDFMLASLDHKGFIPYEAEMIKKDLIREMEEVRDELRIARQSPTEKLIEAFADVERSRK